MAGCVTRVGRDSWYYYCYVLIDDQSSSKQRGMMVILTSQVTLLSLCLFSVFLLSKTQPDGRVRNWTSEAVEAAQSYVIHTVCHLS